MTLAESCVEVHKLFLAKKAIDKHANLKRAEIYVKWYFLQQFKAHILHVNVRILNKKDVRFVTSAKKQHSIANLAQYIYKNA